MYLSINRMAQRISKAEYDNQTTEYTKKALALLNQQMNLFKRDDRPIQLDEFEEDEDGYKIKRPRMSNDNVLEKKIFHLEELLKKRRRRIT